jgi:pyruvate/2-oxoglutarate dehydrogenase complex dihydrolipoamide acyltransferase (E2) component
MSEKIAFVYDEKRNPRNAFIPGIPNRNMTNEEFEALNIRQQSAVASASFFIPAAQVPDEFEDALEGLEPDEYRMENFPDPFENIATEEAKALAAEHGIELLDVDGTGQDGRILKRDVLALIDGAE